MNCNQSLTLKKDLAVAAVGRVMQGDIDTGKLDESRKEQINDYVELVAEGAFDTADSYDIKVEQTAERGDPRADQRKALKIRPLPNTKDLEVDMCLFQMDTIEGNEDSETGKMRLEYASCKTIIKNCDKTRQAQANQALMDIIG